MRLIDNLFKKIKGSYFAILGSGIFLTSLLIAMFIYIISDPSFSIITHWVSDLGEGPNFSNYISNIGIFVSSICYFFFLIFLTRELYKENKLRILLICSFILGLLASIGMILSGIFPMYTAPEIHFNAATISFITISLSIIIYGYLESLIDGIPKFYSFLSYTLSVINIVFMISFLLDDLNLIHAKEFYLFFEWLSIFSIIIWFFSQGVFTMNYSN